jgi:hypothetical protein
MTPAEIIAELRRQAGLRNATWPCMLLMDMIPLFDEFERMAAVNYRIQSEIAKAVADEREVCAKSVEAIEVHDVGHPGTAFAVQGMCVGTIRARGNKVEAA